MQMNHDKAREHFSAYYEGTLGGGLKEAFERSLRTDAQIQAEYRAFEQLMSQLEVLKQPVPEPDFDLHEAVARRLDSHIFEEKRKKAHPLLSWWKGLALGGLATVALVMAVVQMNSSGPVGVAGLGGGPSAVTEKVELVENEGAYSLQYSTRGSKSVVIRAADGAVLAERTVADGRLISPLSNPNEKAKLIQIEVSGESQKVFAALPGTRASTVSKGEGSVTDLALALAGFYRTAVLVTEGDPVQVAWQFGVEEGLDAAEKSLAETKYTVHKNADGVLSIQPN
jgi:hypothetical protein